MEQKIKDLKQVYEQTKIPKELDDMINKTINEANNKNNVKKRSWRLKTVLAGTAAACLIFVFTLNTSEAFAMKLGEIPVISNIAKLLTFVDYNVESDFIVADVTIPAIEGLGDSKLEKKINDEIYAKMQSKVAESEERAKEYKQAYIETGGKEEDFRPVEVTVNYEVKSTNNDILSFTIYRYESLASAYAETFYYNIDLKENKTINLEDMLGDNYKEIADESIRNQIEKLKEDPNYTFFEGEMGFTGIKDNHSFYVNEDGKAVIVFDKYEIAPGSMGMLEFVIE